MGKKDQNFVYVTFEWFLSDIYDMSAGIEVSSRMDEGRMKDGHRMDKRADRR